MREVAWLRRGEEDRTEESFVVYGRVRESKVHQVLHRPQNKERPMQNNFEAPVWQLKMVFECSIAWCDLGLGRATVHCQRNHPRKPKFSRNGAILSDHFLGVKFYNGLFLDRPFFGSASAFFSTVRLKLRISCRGPVKNKG